MPLPPCRREKQKRFLAQALKDRHETQLREFYEGTFDPRDVANQLGAGGTHVTWLPVLGTPGGVGVDLTCMPAFAPSHRAVDEAAALGFKKVPVMNARAPKAAPASSGPAPTAAAAARPAPPPPSELAAPAAVAAVAVTVEAPVAAAAVIPFEGEGGGLASSLRQTRGVQGAKRKKPSHQDDYVMNWDELLDSDGVEDDEGHAHHRHYHKKKKASKPARARWSRPARIFLTARCVAFERAQAGVSGHGAAAAQDDPTDPSDTEYLGSPGRPRRATTGKNTHRG